MDGQDREVDPVTFTKTLDLFASCFPPFYIAEDLLGYVN
jgi:hypothetical protein